MTEDYPKTMMDAPETPLIILIKKAKKQFVLGNAIESHLSTYIVKLYALSLVRRIYAHQRNPIMKNHQEPHCDHFPYVYS